MTISKHYRMLDYKKTGNDLITPTEFFNRGYGSTTESYLEYIGYEPSINSEITKILDDHNKMIVKLIAKLPKRLKDGA